MKAYRPFESLMFNLIFILIFANTALAKNVTVMKEYTYQASDIDSKVTSRINALEQVKKLLLEELGVFVLNETQVSNSILTKDQIISISAGIVKTDIIEETWDGKQYWVKAQVVADTAAVKQALESIVQNKEKMDQLNAANSRIEELTKEIEDIKKEASSDVASQRKYARLITRKQATDSLLKAFMNRDIKSLDKAIEIDPKFSDAYYLRAAAWSSKHKNYNKALQDATTSIELYNTDEDADSRWSLSHRFEFRSRIFYRLGNVERTVDDFFKALEIEGPVFTSVLNTKEADVLVNKLPGDWRVYVLRSFINTNYPNGDLQRALSDAKKAKQLQPNSPYPYLSYLRVLERTYGSCLHHNSTSGPPCDKMLDNYYDSIRVAIQKSTADSLKWKLLRFIAEVHFDRGEYDLAIEEYNNALQINLDYGGLYYGRGLAYKAMKMYREAISDFQKSLVAKISISKSSETSFWSDSNWGDSRYGDWPREQFEVYAAIAATYGEMGEKESALKYYDYAVTKGLDLYRSESKSFKPLFVNTTSIRNVLWSRVGYFENIGQFDAAISDLNEMMKINKKCGDPCTVYDGPVSDWIERIKQKKLSQSVHTN